MFHVILHEPEIPPNTGNVIRLCANTGATLHLVRPLGFRLDAKAVRRAGLDYRELAEVRIHSSLAACLESLAHPRWFAYT
ncbi:MAG TPA: TrmH family RNA methyltransferase, partial [Steroidobacteraceae bacterium]|nr:TrmH family RNA methyltransferase [Steroidobacteraceae bacterium]